MQIPAANGQKNWSLFGHVTIVIVFVTSIFVTPDKKDLADPEMDPVKMQIPATNGQKTACNRFALNLAKQPSRGPFAHELRNQTGGNKISAFRVLIKFRPPSSN